jgi:hypothetical protein
MEAVIVKADMVKDIPQNELTEIVDAWREGRIRICKRAHKETCGSCVCFARKPGRNSGKCMARKTGKGTQKEVYSKRPCCSAYKQDESVRCL